MCIYHLLITLPLCSLIYYWKLRSDRMLLKLGQMKVISKDKMVKLLSETNITYTVLQKDLLIGINGEV